MCKGGLGGLFGGGGLGGLLGGLLGGGLDLAFPEIGIPLSLATGAGGFLGNLAGGGNIGSAATEGLTLGAAGGLGNAALGGSFFGAPTGAGISGLFGGGAAPAAGGDIAGAAGSGGLSSSGIPAAGVTDFAGGPATTTVLDATALPAAASSLPGAAGTAATGAPTALTTVGAAAPTTTAATTAGTAAGVPATTTGAVADAAGGGAADATLGSKILNYLKANPMTLLTAGAATYPLLQGNTTPGLSDLKTQAALEGRIGGQEAQALQTGQLPQGAQSALDAATEAEKAQIAGNYARLGLTGSTMEAEAKAMVDARTAAQKFGMLKDVTTAGMSAINSSDNLLKTIMDTEVSQDKQTSDAIARLVAALAGGGAGAAKAAA